MDMREFEQVIADAETTMRQASNLAERLGRLLVGRLRSVSPCYLKKLKRELRDFNIHTGEWKDR